jgi:hypothetical protein
MKMLEHPPFSPELPTADFYLLPGPKSSSKGRSFGDTTVIIKYVTKELKRRLQNGFQGSFQQLDSRWQKCTFGQGDYFERKTAKVIVLFYILLLYIVFLYIVLFYIELLYIVLCYIALFYNGLCYILLVYIALFKIVLFYIVLFYIAFYIVLFCIVLFILCFLY